MRPARARLPWRQVLWRAGWAASWASAPLGAAGSSRAAGPAAPGVTGLTVSRTEEEVFLFALRLDQSTLSAAFPGFPVQDGFLLPLGELCRLLDLAVEVDPLRGLAEGFLIQEERRFRLDVLQGTVEIHGVKTFLDRSLIEQHTDDIYVDARLLSTWLPLDLAIVKRSATVTVLPREPLPLQLRWKREQITALRDMATSATMRISDMPRADSPNLQRMETLVFKVADLEEEVLAEVVTHEATRRHPPATN